MRIITGLFIIFCSFSYSFAYSFEESLSFGFYGNGYIPMETDKDFIGYGGGAGVKFTVDFNNYFALGALSGLTIASSNNNNTKHLTFLNDNRILFIFQKGTDRGESGFVPWGSLGFGFLTGSGSYGSYQKLEDGVGFNIVLSAGLRYNFPKAYIGIGAEYSFARLYGDLISSYSNGYYYPSRSNTTINPSGFNIFGEFGFRL